MIYWQLFFEFAKVSIFCVGGGYASMPLIQDVLVETHHWLTLTEFIDIFTISQMTPGPIGINAATFAGTKIAGLGGAIAATVGFVTPSFFLGIFLAGLFYKYGDIGPIRGVLNGLRPAVVALISSAGISFVLLALWDSEAIPKNFGAINLPALIILICTLIAVKKKVSVIKVLAGSGILGLILGLCM